MLVCFSAISPVQYVVNMICARVHCGMKFAVAVACLVMLNVFVSICGNLCYHMLTIISLFIKTCNQFYSASA